MRILIVSHIANKMILKESNAIPTIGSKVDAFYIPYPVVKDLLFYPDEKTLRGTGYANANIDVMVYVN